MKSPDFKRLVQFLPSIGAGVLFGLFLFFKGFSLHWYISDENIYYCMARDLGWSHLPYRDFFYANPPLLLFMLKLGGLLSNWGLEGMRCIPIFCHVGAGLIIWRLFVAPLGFYVLVPLGLHLFSYDALRASTHSTGITESLLLIHLAIFFAVRRQALWAGVMLGLGLWIKTYTVTAVPMVSMILLFRNWEDRKKAVGSMGSFLSMVVFMVVILALVGSAFGGVKFWEMNVTYHLSKQPSEEGGSWEVFSQVAYRNQGSLYVLGLCLAVGGLAMLPWFRNKFGEGHHHAGTIDKSIPQLILPGLIHLVSVFVFLVLQGRIFDFYMLLFLPGLSFVCAGCLIPCRKYLWSAVGQKPQRWTWRATEGFFLLLVTLILAHPLIPRSSRLFIQDLVTYQQHEARHADELSRWNPLLSVPGTQLFGDSGTAPLVALMSGAEVALGEVDTNQMRFQGGFPAPTPFVNRLEKESVQWAVVRGRIIHKNRFIPRGLFTIPEFLGYLQNEFSSVDRVLLEGDTEIRLMHRNIQ